MLKHILILIIIGFSAIELKKNKKQKNNNNNNRKAGMLNIPYTFSFDSYFQND